MTEKLKKTRKIAMDQKVVARRVSALNRLEKRLKLIQEIAALEKDKKVEAAMFGHEITRIKSEISTLKTRI